MLTPKEDDLQVQVIPILARKDGFEVALGTFNRRPAAEAPARREAVDVGVHWKCRDSEGLGHHHAGRLMSNSWQGF